MRFPPQAERGTGKLRVRASRLRPAWEKGRPNPPEKPRAKRRAFLPARRRDWAKPRRAPGRGWPFRMAYRHPVPASRRTPEPEKLQGKGWAAGRPPGCLSGRLPAPQGRKPRRTCLPGPSPPPGRKISCRAAGEAPPANRPEVFENRAGSFFQIGAVAFS